jgi:TPR repeat protein
MIINNPKNRLSSAEQIKAASGKLSRSQRMRHFMNFSAIIKSVLKPVLACTVLFLSYEINADDGCNDGRDCARKGYELYQNGSYVRARDLLKKSCQQDFAPGCFGLGFLYENGLGVIPEYTRAFGYFSKSCELQFGDACYYVGLYYIEGKIHKVDHDRAEIYFEKACELKHADACAMAASYYLEQKNDKSSELNAAEFRKKACELGSADSCVKQ